MKYKDLIKINSKILERETTNDTSRRVYISSTSNDHQATLKNYRNLKKKFKEKRGLLYCAIIHAYSRKGITLTP